MSPLILNNLPSILGFIAVTLFVFILIRELICWYFKINERIKLQKELNKLLVKLTTNSDGAPKGSNTNQG